MIELIKDSYKVFIYSICILIILLFPMPYYITSGGGIQNLDEKIEIKGGYEGKGSFNLSYVTELEGNLAAYIMSYINPSWEREKIEELKVVEHESSDDINNRGRLSLYRANESSTYVAFQKAGKTINVKSDYYYVYIVANKAIKDVRVGDKLLKVNNIENPDLDEVEDEINNNDKISLTFERDGKEVTSEIEVLIDKETGKRYIGIYFIKLIDFDTDPEITIKKEENESGGSAGLMMSLAIYNALTEYDYTRGLKVAGTGTISYDGTVGAIEGVKYKLAGAVFGGADIFFVPKGENSKEAFDVKEKNNYKITIVEVETFDDAIEYLKNIKK